MMGEGEEVNGRDQQQVIPLLTVVLLDGEQGTRAGRGQTKEGREDEGRKEWMKGWKKNAKSEEE